MSTNNNSSSPTKVSVVNTFRESAGSTKELETKDLSKDDFRALKEADAFMYYSIPGARTASILGQDIESSNTDDALFRRCSSLSTTSSESTSDSNRSDTSVVRKTRISCEVDAFSLMATMLDDIEDDEEDLSFDFEDDYDAECALMQALESIMSLPS